MWFLSVNALNATNFYCSSRAVASPGFVGTIAVATLFLTLASLRGAVFGGVASAAVGASYKGPACSCDIPIFLTIETLGKFAL